MLRKNLKNLGVSDNKLEKDMASKAFQKIKSKEKYRDKDFSELTEVDRNDFRKDLNKELSRKMKAIGYKKDFNFDDIKDVELDEKSLDKAYNEKIKKIVQGSINGRINPLATNPFESDLDRAVNADKAKISKQVTSLDYSENDVVNSNKKIQKLKYNFKDKIKKYDKLSKKIDEKFEEEAKFELNKERKEQFNKENRKLIEELKSARNDIDSLGKKIKDETKTNAKLKIASKYHREDIRTKHVKLKVKAQGFDEKIDGMIDKRINDNANIAPVENTRKIRFMEDIKQKKDKYFEKIKKDNLEDREYQFNEYYQALNEMLEKDSAGLDLESEAGGQYGLQDIQEKTEDQMLMEDFKSEIYEAKNMDDLYKIYDEYVDYKATKEVEKEESIQDELLEDINYNKYEKLFEEEEYDRPAIETDDLEIDDDPYDPDDSDNFINDDKKTKEAAKRSLKKESKEQLSQRARNLTSQLSEKEAELSKLQKELESNNNQTTRIKIIRLRNEISTLRARLSQETSKNS